MFKRVDFFLKIYFSSLHLLVFTFAKTNVKSKRQINSKTDYDKFNLVVYSNGSYALQVNNNTWLESAATFLNANGRMYSNLKTNAAYANSG
jgi:hypothetical protein